MNDKRGNRKAFTPLGVVIDKVLRQHRPATQQSLIEVWDVWETAVGPAIAGNARPAAFKGNLLLIHVANSTWLHHLHFLEKELIAKLGQALGDERVQAIKLKIGPV